MMKILPFSPQHGEGVVSVILPIQQEEFGISITLESQPDLLDIESFYQRGNGNFWVAVTGGEVVGTLALLDIGNRQGALRKMFVKSSFRGPEHGVAKRLLDTLLQWCRLRDMQEIYLGTTENFVAAHRFYEKNGFNEVTRSQLPSNFPVMSVDTKFYSLALTR
jgi:N-acetylglutamate synthase-like GNAT family acetyltransferase